MSSRTSDPESPDVELLDVECVPCGEGDPVGECPESRRPCGHHCNHIWTHDSCCWCGADAWVPGTETP